MSGFHQTTLERVEPLGLDHLSAHLIAESSFQFDAGQWANVLIRTPGAEAPESRAISFASAPSDLPHLELCVRRRPQSIVVAALEEAHANDQFELQGPFGAFRWSEPVNGPVLFVATSTGIAPVRSLLREAAVKGPVPFAALLFHAVADDRDHPYENEEAQWKNLWPALRVKRLRMSEQNAEHLAATWSPLVQEAIGAAEQLSQSPQPFRAFLAGHGTMIQPLREHLRNVLQVERARIKAETFWP